jgi:L-ascorbate metabolism protein UlaG (beta-lactamase superfamily)
MSRRTGLHLGLAAAFAAGTSLLLWLLFAPTGLEDYDAHRYDPPPPAPDALTATWFGTTAVLLSDGVTSVFIDPFFSRPGGLINVLRNVEVTPDEAAIRDWLARARIERLDAVAVSHSHYDHAMDAPRVAQLTGAMLLGSRSTANIGRGGGLPEERIIVAQSGLPIAAGAFRVTFIESSHAGATGGRPRGEIAQPLRPPARILDYRQGGTYSILVEHPQGRVLHHGSAGFVPGMLKLRRADVVLLGIAAMPDLGDYLAEVVDAVAARRIIPVHWDDFTRPLAAPLVPMPLMVDLRAFFAHLRKRPELSVQTLELGRRVALFPPQPAT